MPDQAVVRAYRVVSIPQLIVVSKRGVVDWVHYGALKDAHISELFPTMKISDGR
jgi:predicted transcriptional regulator